MLVERVMTTDLVTAPSDASLREVVRAMLEHEVGSVLFLDDGALVGILTETDIAHAGYVTDRPFSAIPARKVMTTPVVTTSPGKTLRRAVDIMVDEGIKKLPVVADLELVGIVTASDLLTHYPDLRRELYHSLEPNRGRTPEDSRFDLE